MKFGEKSLERLATCHPDLQMIMKTAILITDIDFGISEGYRSVEKQKELFAQGRTKPGPIVTKVDGINTLSKHNYNPSLALDFYAFVNGKLSYETRHMMYLSGIFRAVSEMLYLSGDITHKIRMGSNFDMDGELLEESFTDQPHIELIT